MASSSSTLHSVVAAVAGAAAALALMVAFAPQTPVDNWTATSTGVKAISVASVPQLRRTMPIAQPEGPLQMTTQALDTPTDSSKTLAPVVLAVSGLTALVAAAAHAYRRSFGASEDQASNGEYSVLALGAEIAQHRAERERREREKAEAVKREIQDRLRRLQALSGGPVPTSAPAAAPISSSSDWKARQAARERAEKAKAEAAKREIQERLQRLSRLSSSSGQQPVATSPRASSPSPSYAAPAASNTTIDLPLLERRQQEREFRERQKAEAAQREIQERLQRLSRLGAAPAPSAAPSSAPASMVNDWEVRQQARERAEREKAEKAQREIQERLQRLQRLSGGSPVASAPQRSSSPPPAASASLNSSELSRHQAERERRERAKAEQMERELQERLQRLMKLQGSQVKQGASTW